MAKIKNATKQAEYIFKFADTIPEQVFMLLLLCKVSDFSCKDKLLCQEYDQTCEESLTPTPRSKMFAVIQSKIIAALT